MRQIRSISRLICKISKNLILNLVILFPENKEFFNIRNDYNRDVTYINIDLDITSLIGITVKYGFTLLNKSIIDSEKNGFERIYLTQATQVEFINVIKRFIHFVENTDGIFVYDKDTKHVEINYELFKNNRFEYIYKDYKIRFTPRIIDNNTTEQYVNILFEYIGDTKAIFTKVALIRYLELKALCAVLERIDLFIYSQALLNYVGKRTKFMDSTDLRNAEVISSAFDQAEKRMLERLEKEKDYNEEENDGN